MSITTIAFFDADAVFSNR